MRDVLCVKSLPLFAILPCMRLSRTRNTLFITCILHLSLSFFKRKSIKECEIEKKNSGFFFIVRIFFKKLLDGPKIIYNNIYVLPIIYYLIKTTTTTTTTTTTIYLSIY